MLRCESVYNNAHKKGLRGLIAKVTLTLIINYSIPYCKGFLPLDYDSTAFLITQSDQ